MNALNIIGTILDLAGDLGFLVLALIGAHVVIFGRDGKR